MTMPPVSVILSPERYTPKLALDLGGSLQAFVISLWLSIWITTPLADVTGVR